MIAGNITNLSKKHYQQVRQKLQADLDHSHLDAIIALSPENIVYLFGLFVPTHRANSERLYLAFFRKNGDSSLLVSSVGERFARLQVEIEDIRVYVEYQESPMRAVADLIEEQDLQKGRIGVEMEFLTANFYRELLHYLPHAEFVDGSGFLRKIRLIKDEEEIKLIKRVAIITEKAIARTFCLAQVSTSLEAMKRNAVSTIGRYGADHINFCVLDRMSGAPREKEGGRRGKSPGALEAGEHFQEGEVIKIDLSGDFKGYMSDVLRLAVVGKPGKKLLRGYQTYLGLHKEIIDMMRPGRRVSEVFEFYKRRFQEEGLLPRTGAHIGHSLGTCLHEHPMINAAHDDLLMPFMVMNVEPIGLSPDLDGTRLQLESTILITEDKPELLSTHSNLDELYIIQ